MDRITDKYVFFWGSGFSNWFPVQFEYEGKTFHNSEQAFMWEKAKLFGDEETAEKILNTSDPKTAKELGRQVKNFDGELWQKYSYNIMVAVNHSKYSQNEVLKRTLLSTGDKIIVEASPVDNIWGIGIHWRNNDCLDEANWTGLNLLGKALIDVRKSLRLESV